MCYCAVRIVLILIILSFRLVFCAEKDSKKKSRTAPAFNSEEGSRVQNGRSAGKSGNRGSNEKLIIVFVSEVPAHPDPSAKEIRQHLCEYIRSLVLCPLRI